MADKTLRDRLSHAWNAFKDKSVTEPYTRDYGVSYSSRPGRIRLSGGNERSIVSSVYSRLGLDAASVPIKHVRLDERGRYIDTIDSSLNRCLTIEANVDQSGRSLMQDIVMSMFDEGSVAIVPVDTTLDPKVSGSYDIQTIRTGQILEWYPKHVRVRLYNDNTGQAEDVTLSKLLVAIVENPLSAVMNEPSSTLKRLISKLNLLDSIDNQSGSGKLDLIVQLPYTIKTETKRRHAEDRKAALEAQLTDSKYGIGYIDSTEKVTQLNRPAENNLMGQIEYLTRMLYSQLGITEAIFDGTADQAALLNYYNRTIYPVVTAVTDAMTRTFLTKTGRSQGQSIAFFKNPFAFVTASELAEVADKFTRNEIMTSNEFRAEIGLRPDESPESDELRNKNLNQPDAETPKAETKERVEVDAMAKGE